MNNFINDLPSNNLTKWIYDEHINLYNKHSQYVEEPVIKISIKEEPVIKISVKEEPIIEKQTIKIKPIELILKLSDTDLSCLSYVKDKIIDFIGNPNTVKLFGLKKTSEMMTAITKNTWNQSIVLLISFLLDCKINYKNKEYNYYKENNNIKLIMLE